MVALEQRAKKMNMRRFMFAFGEEKKVHCIRQVPNHVRNPIHTQIFRGREKEREETSKKSYVERLQHFA